MIDLTSAVQVAVYQALSQRVPGDVAEVFDAVPAGTIGSYIQVGDIDWEPEDKSGRLFLVDVNTTYLGKDRGALLGLMHVAETALADQPLDFEGVEFSEPEFVGATVSSTPIPTAKGLLYAGKSTFEISAWPA